MITVVGEALVDLIEGPPGTPEAHPGGSPANVAVALARLGTDAALLTQVGDDAYGRLVLGHLRANGVRLAAGCLLDAAPTGTARTVLRPDGQAGYTFDVAWRGFGAEASTVDSRCVHTGSIATFLEPGAAHVAALLRAARGTATVSYDPNCRPALMGDPAAARRGVERLAGLSDVVKVSQEDLAWLYPGRRHDDVGRDWLALGARLVVVTLGADGAWGGTGRVAVTVPPVPVTVVDTVGAGDAFTAGLLHACDAAGLLGAAARDRLAAVDAGALAGLLGFAARVAGLTCARRGADPPTLADLAAQPGGAGTSGS